jgi:hypothetical protein
VSADAGAARCRTECTGGLASGLPSRPSIASLGQFAFLVGRNDRGRAAPGPRPTAGRLRVRVVSPANRREGMRLGPRPGYRTAEPSDSPPRASLMPDAAARVMRPCVGRSIPSPAPRLVARLRERRSPTPARASRCWPRSRRARRLAGCEWERRTPAASARAHSPLREGAPPARRCAPHFERAGFRPVAPRSGLPRPAATPDRCAAAGRARRPVARAQLPSIAPHALAIVAAAARRQGTSP